MKGPWTSKFPLSGGNMSNWDFKSFPSDFQNMYHFLPPYPAEGIAHRHGTLVDDLFKDLCCLSDLGEHLGYGLYEKEIRNFAECEWAHTPEVILWRRT